MRALTILEKAQSQIARKRANEAISLDRRKVGALRNVKGSPAIVRLDGREITLNYELLRGMLRKLKGRRIDMRIRNPFEPYLIILHEAPGGRSKGEIELKQLPEYHRIHLSELPIIQFD